MLRLRIATLNCLNLALPGRIFYPAVEPYGADEYIAKTQWLATMFDRLAADLVLVQEVFHEQALSDVVRQTASGARGWSLAVPFADQANALPRLGLAWRSTLRPRLDSIVDLSPGHAVVVPDKAEHARFSRPLLRAALDLPDAAGGTTLTLLNVHLKSRRPEYLDSEDRDDPQLAARAQLRALVMRAAEAAALRAIVIEAMRGPRTPLVVAGDFNDEINAVTTQMVADTSWTPDDRPQRDHMLFDALEVERRIAPVRGRDVAYTVLHGGEPQRIDHVLVSEEFAPQSKRAIGQVASVAFLNDHLVERRQPRGATGPDLTRIYSDHAAVAVDLVFD
ncbi:MAG: endonuclease/exonuclease/phosphatase family protein [Gemmatimonadota bacterium]